MYSQRELMMELFADEFPDWEFDEDSVVCPCGTELELDGVCNEGHASPLRQMGMI